jgi:hypothetical protein
MLSRSLRCFVPFTFWLLFLCGAIHAFLPSAVYSSTERQKNSSQLSLKAENEPLKSVLARLSQASGYAITVNKEAEDLPVTINLKGLSVFDITKQLVGSLKSPGYTMRANSHEIALTIFNTRTDGRPTVPSEASKSKSVDQPMLNSSEIEVIPPTPDGQSAITLAEMQEAANRKQEVDPSTIEAIPPTNGEQGITLQSMQASASTDEQDADPYTIEVIPPTEPNGKGITLGEMRTAATNEQETDPLIEIIPPTGTDGKGITLGEMQQSVSPQDQVATPSPSAQTLSVY